MLFMGTWIFLVNAWCVGLLNTDFTDYSDVFIGGASRLEALVPL